MVTFCPAAPRGVGLLAATKHALKACSMPWSARSHRSESKRPVQPRPTATAFRRSRLRAPPKRLRPDGARRPQNHLSASTASILRSGTDRRRHPHSAGNTDLPCRFALGEATPGHACGVERSAGRSGRLVERHRDRRRTSSRIFCCAATRTVLNDESREPRIGSAQWPRSARPTAHQPRLLRRIGRSISLPPQRCPPGGDQHWP